MINITLLQSYPYPARASAYGMLEALVANGVRLDLPAAVDAAAAAQAAPVPPGARAGVLAFVARRLEQLLVDGGCCVEAVRAALAERGADPALAAATARALQARARTGPGSARGCADGAGLRWPPPPHASCTRARAPGQAGAHCVPVAVWDGWPHGGGQAEEAAALEQLPMDSTMCMMIARAAPLRSRAACWRRAAATAPWPRRHTRCLCRRAAAARDGRAGPLHTCRFDPMPKTISF